MTNVRGRRRARRLIKPRPGFEPLWRIRNLPAAGNGETDPTWGPVLVSANGPLGPETVPGDRLHHLFDARCARFGKRRARSKVALDFGDFSFSYSDLAGRANQIARFLFESGVRSGDRVALLVDRSILSPAAVLAASQLDVVYVPLDAGFPPDRLAYIVNDSGASLIVTLSRYRSLFADLETPILALDEHYHDIGQLSSTRFDEVAIGAELDPICYVIYTSGSTGTPKGVAVRHSNIVNFVRIAAAIYGYCEDDRIYQAMTVAFDFSVEELWVPLVVGATLVPAPSDSQLVGSDLQDFLRARSVTALCCVPTLLATLEPELPELQFLLVSGEACPVDLIEAWFAPGRRILNAYGPTETTVTATWSLLESGWPITIGGPLPSYSIVILDPETQTPMPLGTAGEICVGGPGLADGYVNRPEQTAAAFIDDPFPIPGNHGGRLYRTGDLGRINVASQIEFMGRIDTQVKIRGYRVELDEIEVVARTIRGVGNAVVHTHQPEDGGVQLVAYLTPTALGESVDVAAVQAELRRRLPAYMVPTYFEQLDELPLLPSTKVDRAALPPPAGPRFVGSAGQVIAPRNDLEARLAALLADLLGLDEVSIEAHFLDDLGADSLTLAAFVTALRADLGIKRVSMKRLYQAPTIAALAETLPAAPTEPRSETPPVDQPMSDRTPRNDEAERSRRPEPTQVGPSTRCAAGLLQTLVFLVFTFVVAAGSILAYRWVQAGEGLVGTYLRSVEAGAAMFFGGSGLLIAIKWASVGRFTTEPIPIWSLRYVRFWTAKTAIMVNPMNLLVGTPAYNTYLRLLGVRIGADTVIFARPPICTDLIGIGRGTVIRQDAVFLGYTAEAGWILPGTVTIGSDVLIAEATVVGVDTAIGDRVQLGTSSTVPDGQKLASGSIYHGSPAEPSTTDFLRVPTLPIDRARRARYTVNQLVTICFITMPASLAATYLLAGLGLSATGLIPWSGSAAGLLGLGVIAAVWYFGALILSMVVTFAGPRILNLFFVPDEVHPLYGFQYHLARGIQRLSNNLPLNIIFGDSSMIVYYLQAVGYDLTRSTQTGSNFGVDQRHHSPFLCTFDRDTLVSDGLRMLNLETSASSFIARPITMPPETYVGNLVHYPANAALGANCLIATKAAVPIDGPIHSDVGILGSPAFEIPRSVARDHRFDDYKQPGVFEQRLRLKLRSNLATLAIYLSRSYLLMLLTVAYGLGSFAVFTTDDAGVTGSAVAITLATTLTMLSGATISILFERAVRGFRPLEPLYCSLYDARFWAHERFWKLNYNLFLRSFDGTPMKPVFLRLQGAKVGQGLFDDGSGLTEPSLVEIGADCTLNYQSALQCHSLEDGTFKSDRIRVGNSCTVGVHGFVHYGTTLGDRSTLAADSFLMKGSVMAADSHWQGNPAKDSDQATATSDTPRSLHMELLR